MPKSDFGHPRVTVGLKTRTNADGKRVQLVEVCDTDTGEILKAEVARSTTEWLQSMRYEWVVGSHGKWQQRS